MRLCFVNPALQRRAEIFKVAENIPDDVTILQPGKGEDVRPKDNVLLRRVNAWLPSIQDSVVTIPFPRSWRRELSGDYDAIHICDYFYLTSFLPFLLEEKKPAVLSTNALLGIDYSLGTILDPFASCFTRLAGLRLIRKFDKVVAVYNRLARDLKERGVKNVEVIGAGVDFAPELLTDRREKTRELYGIAQDAKVVLSLCNLVRVKRVDITIREAAKAGAKTIVLGKGPRMADLMAYARDIRADCDFKGYVSESVKQDCIAMADVLMVTSVSEGIPMSALECMAAGLPVVSNDMGGMSDVVMPEQLVKGGDYQPALRRLLSDQNEAKRVGVNAAKLVRATRKWSDVGARYHKVFEEVAR